MKLGRRAAILTGIAAILTRPAAAELEDPFRPESKVAGSIYDSLRQTREYDKDINGALIAEEIIERTLRSGIRSVDYVPDKREAIIIGAGKMIALDMQRYESKPVLAILDWIKEMNGRVNGIEPLIAFKMDTTATKYTSYTAPAGFDGLITFNPSLYKDGTPFFGPYVSDQYPIITSASAIDVGNYKRAGILDEKITDGKVIRLPDGTLDTRTLWAFKDYKKAVSAHGDELVPAKTTLGPIPPRPTERRCKKPNRNSCDNQ
jgi:hypothetical protein